jgi:D-inositol-3-phosphate glycosyltransferase
MSLEDGQTVERAPLVVAGWALAGGVTVVRVDVLVDGRPVGRARLALPRLRLFDRFGGPEKPFDPIEEPEASVCGFDHWIVPSDMPQDGRMRVGAVAELSDGSRHPLPEVTVTLADEAVQHEVARADAPAPRAVQGPMRLLAFTNDLFYGGAQLYLLELLRSLNARPDVSAAVLSPKDGPLRERFEDLSIPVHVSRVATDSERSYEESLAELMDWAAAGGFNFVLANTISAFAGIDLAARLHVPSVWAIQGSVRFPRWIMDIRKSTYARYVHEKQAEAFGLTQAVVFAAHATRRQYVHLGDQRRFVVLPYGIDLPRIDDYRQQVTREQARRELGIPEGATALLCLGTIGARKGQAAVAKAFALIADRHPDAYLYLVGDRERGYSRALREYLKRTGQQRIAILPSTADPFRWHVAADAFVMASNNESLPISMIEAMAFETPVLATEIFGVPELIRDGETGYLCADRDIASLAQGLGRLLTAPADETVAITRRAAAVVHERHDLQDYISSFSRLLDSVSRDPGGPPAVPGDHGVPLIPAAG